MRAGAVPGRLGGRGEGAAGPVPGRLGGVPGGEAGGPVPGGLGGGPGGAATPGLEGAASLGLAAADWLVAGLGAGFAAAGWVAALLTACAALLALRRRLELVARAEHELRGAATVISMAVERTRGGASGHRDSMLLEAELARMRAGLGDLTAARAGHRAAEARSPAAVERLARSALGGWAAALGEAGRQARFSWSGARTPQLDAGRVSQALGNLVANAVEHGSGAVDVRGRSSAGGVRVEVRSGLPSPPPTGRVDEALDAAPAPSGERQSPSAPPTLAPSGDRAGPERGRGLAIARAAARAAGGSLELGVEDDEVVAALELPAAAGRPPPRAARRLVTPRRRRRRAGP